MNNPSKNKNIILIDYYQGAYAPTIKIDVVSLESLRKLKKLFVSLAKSANIEVNLLEIENIEAIRIDKFILQSVSDDKKFTKKLTLNKQDNKKNIFQWKLSPYNWETVVCLTQHLLDDKSPGHQYLTKEGIDDALVELSFLERENPKIPEEISKTAIFVGKNPSPFWSYKDALESVDKLTNLGSAVIQVELFKRNGNSLKWISSSDYIHNETNWKKFTNLCHQSATEFIFDNMEQAAGLFSLIWRNK